MKWTIANKLIGGFGAVVLILLLTVFFNYRGLSNNDEIVSRVAEVRSPTALASLKTLNGVNQSLADLRGWMLLNKEEYVTSRARTWKEQIDGGVSEMEVLSKKWTNRENVERLEKLKESLSRFRDVQGEIETIANTPENNAAMNMLLTKAMPPANIMTSNITAMIDVELGREATALRKNVLGMQADVRGTLGLALGSLRAYLLTGDLAFKNQFETYWQKNEKRYNDLVNNYGSLNRDQQHAFDQFRTAREEFVRYPSQIFVLRSGDDWNKANYLLATKALPLTNEISGILNELTTNQRNLLAEDSREMQNTSSALKFNSVLSALMGTALAVFITFFITRGITRSLAGMNNNIKSITEGDLSGKIETSGSDEIAEAMRNMARMTSKLKEVIGAVISTADNMAGASSQISSTAEQMSQGAQEQAASAEEISASMEEITSSIQQNTDNAQQTEKIALKAAVDIREGSDVVAQSVESMKKIAGKISIISEIARQTNLLALNAAVEAARAGDHGKGFAVVALEVRKLAERSQIAASEINQLSYDTLAVADRSGKLLQEIVPGIENTARLVQEIAASSMEQNGGAGQVNTAIQQFNQVIQQNAASAEEMSSSSEELASQAEELRETISFFNVGATGGITHSGVRRVGGGNGTIQKASVQNGRALSRHSVLLEKEEVW